MDKDKLQSADNEDESLLGESNGDRNLWDSPVKAVTKSSLEKNNGPSKATSSEKYISVEQQSRDATLQDELANVRKVNEAIEGVIHSLEKAKTNMKTVNQTVGAASSLLNTWTRILSQTEHNQRLILDPTWHGTSQDMVDIEADTIAEQQAVLQREAEERERRDAMARKADEEERRKAVNATKTTRPPARGRGRGIARGSGAQTGYLSTGGPANTSSTNIGRGSSSTRRATSGIGRARGARDQV